MSNQNNSASVTFELIITADVLEAYINAAQAGGIVRIPLMPPPSPSTKAAEEKPTEQVAETVTEAPQESKVEPKPEAPKPKAEAKVPAPTESAPQERHASSDQQRKLTVEGVRRRINRAHSNSQARAEIVWLVTQIGAGSSHTPKELHRLRRELNNQAATALEELRERFGVQEPTKKLANDWVDRLFKWAKDGANEDAFPHPIERKGNGRPPLDEKEIKGRLDDARDQEKLKSEARRMATRIARDDRHPAEDRDPLFQVLLGGYVDKLYSATRMGMSRHEVDLAKADLEGHFRYQLREANTERRRREREAASVDETAQAA